MKILKILQLLQLVPPLVQSAQHVFSNKPKAERGDMKRDHVRDFVLRSSEIAEMLSRMDAESRSRFERGTNRVIDGVVDWLKSTRVHD